MTTEEVRSALKNAIVGVLGTGAPRKASEILAQLPQKVRHAATKKDVNSLLYGELKGQVVQDKEFRWALIARAALQREGAVGTNEGSRAPGSTPTDTDGFEPTQEQRAIIEFEPAGHLLVRGEAGSGKTTVLAARARRIKSLLTQGTLLFLTYNAALAAYVKGLLRGEGLLRDVEVCTFHHWAREFAVRHGARCSEWLKPSDREKRLTAIVDSVRSGGPQRLFDQPSKWWSEEVAWIYGQGLATVSDYAEASRTGRGTAVQVRGDDRAVVWDVFDRYQKSLRVEDRWDYDDVGGLVLSAMRDRGFAFDASARRDHVFVDEVQDFDKSWLLALLPVAGVSLTLAGDLAQRIYRRSFTWQAVGVKVTGGRSKALKGSFRTTRQIMQVAQHVATNLDLRLEADYTAPTIPGRSGPPVVRFIRPDWRAARSDALMWFAECVKARRRESFVVAVHFNKQLDEVGKRLTACGVTASVARGNELAREKKGEVLVSTYFQLKGLEFDNVLLLGLEDAVMPGWFLSQVPEEDRAESEPFQRRVVYVAMTRARVQLAVAGGSPFSRFFGGVPVDLFEER